MNSTPSADNRDDKDALANEEREQELAELENMINQFRESTGDFIQSLTEATEELDKGIVNFCKSSVEHNHALDAIYEYESQESQRIQQIGERFSGTTFHTAMSTMPEN